MKSEGIFWKLTHLTGPIFGKELVVASRRRRNYVLRFVYIGLLTLFLIFFWAEEIQTGGSALYRASRMSEAGKSMVAMVVWFQFIMCQLVAIVMLSTSISDEIYHKTLGVLMTTPINSFQIVAGKLLSKLLQLIILIAISLPLLAIVRIFGGVPWEFVLCGLCLTLATAVFLGSISLFFSICCRRAYVTIIISFLVVGVIFGLVPLLAAMYFEAFRMSGDAYMKFFAYSHPYFQMTFNTAKLLEPRAAGMFNIPWLYSCSIMLGLSSVVLGLSVALVRRIALRQQNKSEGKGRLNQEGAGSAGDVEGIEDAAFGQAEKNSYCRNNSYAAYSVFDLRILCG
jgi:ABC-2 type transport system permease protein